MINLGNSKSRLAMMVVLVGLLALASACTHRKTVQVGSHKVTILRHGFEKKIRLDENSGVPTFEYKGVSTAGHRLKVTIRGDKVIINDRDYGNLRAGDSVLIGDEGVAVNELDYAQSESYLRANKSTPEATAQTN